MNLLEALGYVFGWIIGPVPVAVMFLACAILFFAILENSIDMMEGLILLAVGILFLGLFIGMCLVILTNDLHPFYWWLELETS